MRATEIFTPNQFPVHTYVERGEEKLERLLKDALETPGEIVSISGPSKSGKTVLVERVVGRENLISISGAGLSSPDDLWDKVLDWMDTPNSSTLGQSSSVSQTNKTAIKLKNGIPLSPQVEAEVVHENKMELGNSKQATSHRKGMIEVIREIGNSDFVVLIDDFHYINRSVQVEVAKQIKEAARQGVKICTASVPHRADDVVRSNPELRGRVRAVDLNYWKSSELIRIAELGFPLLDIMLDLESIKKFVIESSGSPQLMQAICLQACFELDVREKGEPASFTLNEQKINNIFEVVSTKTDFSTLVRNIHSGPNKRGTERNEYDFVDKSRGDVYRCVLLAIMQSPPLLQFPYNELSKRIQNICLNDNIPQASSIKQACSQISKKSDDTGLTQKVIEWENDLFDIIDPYFLFYLRWSRKLSSLGMSTQ